MKRIDQQDNFIYLTFALILLLLGMVLAQQFFGHSVQRIIQSTTVITLLVAVWGVETKRLILRKAFIFTAFKTAKQVLLTGEIDVNKILVGSRLSKLPRK